MLQSESSNAWATQNRCTFPCLAIASFFFSSFWLLRGQRRILSVLLTLVLPQQNHHTQHNLALHPLLGRMSHRQRLIYGR